MSTRTAHLILNLGIALTALSGIAFAVTRSIDNRPFTTLGLIPIALAAAGAISMHLSRRALERGEQR
ncbi:MAG TPA: hypothetical protein VG674_09570 [Amycolatopsis sp.]|nr:hypothetical protein [Amycolatopsis sp.]